VRRFISESNNSINTNGYVKLQIYSVRKYIYFRPEVVLTYGLDISFVSDPNILLILLIYGAQWIHTAQSYQRCWTVIIVDGDTNFNLLILCCSRSQWPRGLRRRSTASGLLRSWLPIPPGAWMSCVLSGRGLCDELITRPEGFHWLWRVVVCDQETSWYEEAIARAGLQC
jgi:hypothetical protein